MDCIERWDLALVACALEELPQKASDYRVLKKVLDEGKDRRLVRYTEHDTMGDHITGGQRMFAEDSFQHISVPLRRFLLAGRAIDLDIKCCGPTLLLQLGEAHGLVLPTLRELVEDRDGLFARIRQDHPTLSNEQLKKAYAVLQFGADYARLATNGVRVAQLDQLRKDFRAVGDVLVALPEHSDVVRHVQRLQDLMPGKSARARTLSKILQKSESAVLQTMIQTLQRQGFEIAANMFDGVLVYDDGQGRRPNLEALESEVFDKTRFRVKIVEKPILPIELETFVATAPRLREDPELPNDLRAIGRLVRSRLDTFQETGTPRVPRFPFSVLGGSLRGRR